MRQKNNYTDKEIAQKMSGSQSTIRNHKFKLREKENLVAVHKGAVMIDDRFAATEEESEKVIKI